MGDPTTTTEIHRKKLEPLDQVTTRCPYCNRIIHDVLLVPNTVVRHKCLCNTWTYIYVISRQKTQ
jgi:hypothetical protein